MKMHRRLHRFAAAGFALVATIALAATFDYGLQPKQIGPDTWMVEGSTDDFSFKNGGNIVNTAFVVTGKGVVVIDTGPSRQYGEQLRQAIARITDQPVVLVLDTHHHPDHFLGNQAFDPKTVKALKKTGALIREDGPGFNENMYRLVGDAMAGTEVTPPGGTVTPGKLTIGSHRFELLSLSGHTPADLAVFDHTTGILFAGDLLFHDRTPTTPNANLAHWFSSLDTLAALHPKLIVPGHGPASTTDAPIRQTRTWLSWLDKTLHKAAAQGLDMNEVIAEPIPKDLAAMSLSKSEFTRSVSHLYPDIELDVLNHPPH